MPRKIYHKAVARLATKNVFSFLPDKQYIKLIYWARTGIRLDLKNPLTFNEKLQWFKLFDRNPEYSKMVDKYEAKKYVAGILGEEYIIPTLGVWDRFEDIDFEKLPDQFVLKCTHDSGGLVICKNKKDFDAEAAKKKINRSLRTDYYKHNREWPYKNVKPRIIAEKYMTDESKTELKDYKVFNFEGKPSIIQVDYSRFVNHRRSMFSTEWKKLPFDLIYPSDHERETELTKPDELNAMLQLAEKLSHGFHFLRTDFYLVDHQIYFGEMTFFPEGGFGAFSPEEWDVRLGCLFNISQS